MADLNLQELEQIDGVGSVFHRPSMTSTSDIARERLLSNPQIALPMLTICDQQTAGRGQPGKSWLSDGQSLTFTLSIAASEIPEPNRSWLSLIAGVSVCESLDALDVTGSKLKWPNDVLIDRKKVCGILVEKISASNGQCFLIGIGINVNQTPEEIEALKNSDAKFPPGSLRGQGSEPIDVHALLKTVVERLHRNVMSESNWPESYQARMDFIGEQIEFVPPGGETITGVLAGVDPCGRICFEVEGKRLAFASGRWL
ncbi:biotin--[acetyl-CoA-carboxylase] ligase [Mariniblastus fucicola]|uniref:Bifunctional ligase/repressor BirA n=1 Tax=Mariniblastus fucicola TaxID=980251 RepID=A0A5B9PE93_9BACT|nr:biotin--[acetyl-CoA-carboxylase] ligase [Mariniblastus fucicola]QEG23819.1 Bifunctional ligase/repressor BirA [Mariniblastus fucicola]